MQSVRAVPRHVEIGFEPRQIAQTHHPRHGGAGLIVGHEIEMPAGLGHILDGNRNLPGRRLLFVCFTFAHVDVRS